MLDGVAQWLKMLAKKRNLNLLAKSLTWEMFQVVLGGPVASRLLLHHGQRGLADGLHGHGAEPVGEHGAKQQAGKDLGVQDGGVDLGGRGRRLRPINKAG